MLRSTHALLGILDWKHISTRRSGAAGWKGGFDKGVLDATHSRGKLKSKVGDGISTRLGSEMCAPSGKPRLNLEGNQIMWSPSLRTADRANMSSEQQLCMVPARFIPGVIPHTHRLWRRGRRAPLIGPGSPQCPRTLRHSRSLIAKRARPAASRQPRRRELHVLPASTLAGEWRGCRRMNGFGWRSLRHSAAAWCWRCS